MDINYHPNKIVLFIYFHFFNIWLERGCLNGVKFVGMMRNLFLKTDGEERFERLRFNNFRSCAA